MRADITERGMAGDRVWAVRDVDGKFGSGKSTRRFRQMNGLLEFGAAYPQGQEVPVLTLPEGSAHPATSPEACAALRQRTGRDVSVAAEGDISHFDEGPLHLVTTSALGLLAGVRGKAVDARRLRHNITLDTGTVPAHLEAGRVGRQLALGDSLVVKIAALMPRCVMVNQAQRQLPEDAQVLKSIAQITPEVCCGVLATVVRPGELRVGDAARLV